MGLMLFVFTPSFYCDTSDAWMIPFPRRSIMDQCNGGIEVVELVLAALATFVWVYTQQDSLVNQIAAKRDDFMQRRHAVLQRQPADACAMMAITFSPIFGNSQLDDQRNSFPPKYFAQKYIVGTQAR